jgi:hypothetical protein
MLQAGIDFLTADPRRGNRKSRQTIVMHAAEGAPPTGHRLELALARGPHETEGRQQ